MVEHVAGVHDLEAATVELERGVLLVGDHEVAGEVRSSSRLLKNLPSQSPHSTVQTKS